MPILNANWNSLKRIKKTGETFPLGSCLDFTRIQSLTRLTAPSAGPLVTTWARSTMDLSMWKSSETHGLTKHQLQSSESLKFRRLSWKFTSCSYPFSSPWTTSFKTRSWSQSRNKFSNFFTLRNSTRTLWKTFWKSRMRWSSCWSRSRVQPASQLGTELLLSPGSSSMCNMRTMKK